MKDPKRWLFDDSTPEEVRELLGAADALPVFEGAAKAAAAHAAQQLAVHGTVAQVTSGLLSAKVSLVVLGIGVATSVGVGIRLATSPGSAAQVASGRSTPAVVHSSRFAARSAGPTTAVLPDPPAAEPSSARPAYASAPADTATRAGDGMADEAALLERARRLLRSDPATALRLTDEHASQYPRGQLGLERELIAVEALVRLSRPLEARRRADRLLVNDPGGLYARRVRELLVSGPADPRRSSQGR